MFFIALCVLAGFLLATKNVPDQSGWMMLLGVAWVAGYLDCRLFAKSDQDRERVLPPDAQEPFDDSKTFQS